MSYDVSIGGEWVNYTYNLGGLFRDVVPGGIYEGLHGKTGRQASNILSAALAKIDAMPEQKLRGYNARNGWGTSIGATTFLLQIKSICVDHPRHRVRCC